MMSCSSFPVLGEEGRVVGPQTMVVVGPQLRGGPAIMDGSCVIKGWWGGGVPNGALMTGRDSPGGLSNK